MLQEIVSKWTLKEWCEGFYGIYGQNDSHRSLSNFWIQVCNDASKVAEAVRRQDHKQTMYHLGNAFCWTCCFAQRLRDDMKKNQTGERVLHERGQEFQEWILNRYPFKCYHCGFDPCHCFLHAELIEKRKDSPEYKQQYQNQVAKYRDKYNEVARRKVKTQRESISKYPLDRLFHKFYHIYGNDVSRASLEDLTFHYLEEVGEVAQAVTTLETLVGENNSKQWEKLCKNDKKLSLVKRFKLVGWEKAFQQAGDSSKNRPESIKKLGRLRKSGRIGSVAFELACKNIMNEMADVFSWSTTIVYKIAKLTKPKNGLSITGVFIGDSNVVGDKSDKRYVFGTDENQYFQCPYCAQRICSLKCPLSSILAKIVKSD